MKKADRLLHSAEAMCRLLHRKRATGDRSGRQKPEWVCDFPPTEGFCSQLVGGDLSCWLVRRTGEGAPPGDF